MRAVLALAILLGAATARAEPLRRHALELDASLDIQAATHLLFAPTTLAPDAWYGVTDRLTVGWVTSAHALSRVEPGGGLCLTGSAHGCHRLYDNIGIDTLYRLQDGAFEIAARARFVVRSFDPMKPSVRPGVWLRWHRGAWAIEADPHVQIGLANRDQGNRDQMSLPLWLRLQLGCHARGWLFTGARGEVIDFGEKYEIPLALGFAARVAPGVEVGAEAGFPAALGPQNELSDRSAYVFVAWHKMAP
jgi:hypothetical protein